MNDSGVFTSKDCMEFLMRFLAMDLETLRPGDWMNLRDDLQRFLHTYSGQGDLVVKGIDSPGSKDYSADDFKSLQDSVRVFFSQAANASMGRTGELNKMGITPSLGLAASFHISRHSEDFVQLTVQGGKLSDVFLLKTLFLLSWAPIEPIRECPECGKFFFRNDKRQKFCARRCANLATTKRFLKSKKSKKGKKNEKINKA